jgi:chromate transporter
MGHNEPVNAATPATNPKPAISHRDLVLTFLKLGTIGFGGGMAIIALMEREFVGKRQAMKTEEFLHGVGLGQLLGAFATNTAFFIGFRLRGVVAGMLSGVALMFPSFAAAILLSWLYFTYHALPALQGVVGGLGPAVIALVVNAGWTMGRKALRSWPAILVAALAMVSGLCRLSPIAALFMAGAFGLALGKRRLSGGKSPSPGNASLPAKEKESVRSAFVPLLAAAQGLSTAGAVSLWQLGFVFFKVGLVFFGGGFVLIPVLYRALVLNFHWLNAQEFIDGIALSNLTPGPIAVLATFAGYRVLGLAGAFTATAGVFLPGVALTFILCYQYERMKGGTKAQDFLAGVVPAAIGLILSAAVLLSRATLHSWQSFAWSAACLLLLVRWRVPPVLVLALCALVGAASMLR